MIKSISFVEHSAQVPISTIPPKTVIQNLGRSLIVMSPSCWSLTDNTGSTGKARIPCLDLSNGSLLALHEDDIVTILGRLAVNA